MTLKLQPKKQILHNKQKTQQKIMTNIETHRNTQTHIKIAESLQSMKTERFVRCHGGQHGTTNLCSIVLR